VINFLSLLKEWQNENYFPEWYSNPAIITVETTDYPIENIPFPTITLCRQDNDLNRFQLIANILDRFKFPCYFDV
jgi:hypothetical protein